MSEPSPAMRKREAIERPLSKRLYKAIWRTPRNWDEIEKLFAELKVLEEFRPTKALEADSPSAITEAFKEEAERLKLALAFGILDRDPNKAWVDVKTLLTPTIKLLESASVLTEKHSASAVGGEKT